MNAHNKDKPYGWEYEVVLIDDQGILEGRIETTDDHDLTSRITTKHDLLVTDVASMTLIPLYGILVSGGM